MADKSYDEVENYDSLTIDPDTLIHGSQGGFSSRRPSLDHSEQREGRIRRTSSDNDPRRRLVRLESTGAAGRFILTADDPELQEIIQMGIAREKDAGAQRRIRDLVFTRQFTTFDRQNPLSAESPFHGFFTLFWLGMVLMFLRVSAQNWRQYGSILGSNELMAMMFKRDVVILGLTDLVMLLSSTTGLFLQKIISQGYIRWSTLGWVVQNIWQSFFLASVIGWTYYREWPWTHTIFMVLHTVVFLMKQHSYAFTNGRLSEVYKRRQLLSRKLRELESKGLLANGDKRNSEVGKASAVDTDINTLPSRAAHSPELSAVSDSEAVDVAKVYKALEAGKPLNRAQVQTFAKVIRFEVESLDTELRGKASSQDQAYPRNLTVKNFVDWTCLPTLVYELEYPRQETINWWYVAEKTVATFGTIGVMMVISQAYIYPSVAQAVKMKDAGMTLQDRWAELPWLISDMLFPLLFEQLLSWYVIWECILNVLAEITRFADRGFYGPWWNSVSWDMYARDWNRPVHNFLLKHVYNSSISTFHLSKTSATFITFLLSALVHELVMACLFKTVRGYLFTMQLMQLPLVSLSRSKLMRGRDLLGNVVFWTGLFIGPSLLTSLYLLI